MNTRFHLAIPAGDLDKAINFIAKSWAVREEMLNLSILTLGQILTFGVMS